jgi:hypothetical protein
MQRGAIGIAIHNYTRDTHLATGAQDTHGDLPAIGDQQLLKHG